MKKMKTIGIGSRKTRIIAMTSVTVALPVGVLLAAGPFAALSARAAGAIAGPQTTGSSSNPILSVSNTGTGEAIDGSAAKNYAIVGRTTGVSTATTNHSGIAGVDAVGGTAASYNFGVFGTSQNGDGVFGTTAFNGWSTTLTTAGVVGTDRSTKVSNGFSPESGVFGMSSVGTGVSGVSKIGNGLYGQTSLASTTYASAGVFGYDANTSVSSFNVGVVGQSQASVGTQGISYSGFGVDGDAYTGVGVRAFSHSGSALRLRADAGGRLATGTNGTKDVMSLDSAGNFIVAGTITQKGSPLIARTTALGTTVATRPIETTSATIEDVGEARLVNGRAMVPLHADFARTIDARAPYLVFITPEGFSSGALAVISREQNAFAVGENNGGRSNVAFAYRIVARPLAESTTRLAPLAEPATSPAERAEPRVHPVAVPVRMP